MVKHQKENNGKNPIRPRGRNRDYKVKKKHNRKILVIQMNQT